MKNLYQVLMLPLLVLLTVRQTEGRGLGGTDESLFLSALCLQSGQVSPQCLQDISTVSIQKLLDRLLEKIRENQRYDDILRQLDDINTDDVIDRPRDVMETRDAMPQKRGRSRNGNTSGFYSNW